MLPAMLTMEHKSPLAICENPVVERSEYGLRGKADIPAARDAIV
jgi:hypothetical protein